MKVVSVFESDTGVGNEGLTTKGEEFSGNSLDKLRKIDPNVVKIMLDVNVFDMKSILKSICSSTTRLVFQ